MGRKKRQQPICSKSDDISAVASPKNTLSQSYSAILAGTLIWSKFKDWPWWPGIVVNNADVGWSTSKKKNSYCILWLGPNKTVSRMATDKLSDFMDPNLNSLMDQLKGEEQEKAICEAIRGLLSQFLDENEMTGNTSVQEMKSMAVQAQMQREEINGRKQVVLEITSSWFKRTIEFLRSVGDGEGASSSSTPHIDPQGWITPECAEFAVSALNYQAKKNEEKSAPKPPPRKKKALSTSSKSRKELQSWKTSTITKRFSRPGRKRKVSECYSDFQLEVEASVSSQPDKKVSEKYVQRGALTNKSVVGSMFEMEKFLQDEQFLNLELPKLIAEEKMRATDSDIDLKIRTSGYQKVQLVSWIRFRFLYHSGRIHVRVLNRKGGPMMLVLKSTDIVVDDETFDILEMKDEPDVSNVVKELLTMLLNPAEKVGLYAFLLCDGLYWRLIGHLTRFNLEPSTPPLLTPEEVDLKSLPSTSSSGLNKKPRNTIARATLPEVILEEYSLSEEYDSTGLSSSLKKTTMEQPVPE